MVSGGDRVHAGLVQPGRRPRRQVAPGSLAGRADEVVQPSVLVREFRQVTVHALAQHAGAGQVAHLVQCRRARRTGDRVDIVERVGGERHRHVARVRAGLLVLDVGAVFAVRLKTLPGILEFGGPGRRQRAHERGKTFVQPQAIPPFHRDRVAKPQVMVEDGTARSRSADNGAARIRRAHCRMDAPMLPGSRAGRFSAMQRNSALFSTVQRHRASPGAGCNREIEAPPRPCAVTPVPAGPGSRCSPPDRLDKSCRSSAG